MDETISFDLADEGCVNVVNIDFSKRKKIKKWR